MNLEQRVEQSGRSTWTYFRCASTAWRVGGPRTILPLNVFLEKRMFGTVGSAYSVHSLSGKPKTKTEWVKKKHDYLLFQKKKNNNAPIKWSCQSIPVACSQYTINFNSYVLFKATIRAISPRTVSSSLQCVLTASQSQISLWTAWLPKSNEEQGVLL